jgi:hypothetical protein
MTDNFIALTIPLTLNFRKETAPGLNIWDDLVSKVPDAPFPVGEWLPEEMETLLFGCFMFTSLNLGLSFHC